MWTNWNVCALFRSTLYPLCHHRSGPLCTIDGTIKWCNLYGRVWKFLRKFWTTRWPSYYSTSGYICKRIERRVLKKYLHAHLHSSTIHNSQEVEAIQMSINRGMNKQNVVRTMEYYLPLKRICYMDDPWGQLSKWNKPVTKKVNTVRVYLYEVSKVGKVIKNKKIECWLTAAGSGGWGKKEMFGYTVLLLQQKKSTWNLLHTNMNIFNINERYT